jgi:hypothetical protein
MAAVREEAAETVVLGLVVGVQQGAVWMSLWLLDGGTAVSRPRREVGHERLRRLPGCPCRLEVMC